MIFPNLPLGLVPVLRRLTILMALLLVEFICSGGNLRRQIGSCLGFAFRLWSSFRLSFDLRLGCGFIFVLGRGFRVGFRRSFGIPFDIRIGIRLRFSFCFSFRSGFLGRIKNTICEQFHTVI